MEQQKLKIEAMERHGHLPEKKPSAAFEIRLRFCSVHTRPDSKGFGFILCHKHKTVGALIASVDPRSPAQYAGLRQGDHIIEVNGEAITHLDHQEMVNKIRSHPQKVDLLVIDAVGWAFALNNNIVTHYITARKIPPIVPIQQLKEVVKTDVAVQKDDNEIRDLKFGIEAADNETKRLRAQIKEYELQIKRMTATNKILTDEIDGLKIDKEELVIAKMTAKPKAKVKSMAVQTDLKTEKSSKPKPAAKMKVKSRAVQTEIESGPKQSSDISKANPVLISRAVQTDVGIEQWASEKPKHIQIRVSSSDRAVQTDMGTELQSLKPPARSKVRSKAVQTDIGAEFEMILKPTPIPQLLHQASVDLSPVHTDVETEQEKPLETMPVVQTNSESRADLRIEQLSNSMPADKIGVESTDVQTEMRPGFEQSTKTSPVTQTEVRSVGVQTELGDKQEQPPQPLSSTQVTSRYVQTVPQAVNHTVNHAARRWMTFRRLFSITNLWKILTLFMSTPRTVPKPRSIKSVSDEMISLHKRTKKRDAEQVPQWTPLYNVNGTVFQDVSEVLIEQLDLAQFEKKFQIDVGVQSPPQEISQADFRTAEEKSLAGADSTWMQDLNTLLQRTGKTPEEICQAIDTNNIRSLSADDIELLSNYIPTACEIKGIITQRLSNSECQEQAEHLALKLSEIKSLDAKMAILVLMTNLRQKMKAVCLKIHDLHNSAVSVQSNKKLKTILQVISVYGNYLNNSREVHGLGFKLKSLPKLNEMKSKDNLTFMQFLVDFLQRKLPSLLYFNLELNINVQQTDSICSISASIEDLREELGELVRKSNTQLDNVHIQRNSARIQTELLEIEQCYTNLESVYKEVCSMFGENYYSPESKNIFVYLTEFTNIFKDTFNQLGLEQEAFSRTDTNPFLCKGNSEPKEPTMYHQATSPFFVREQTDPESPSYMKTISSSPIKEFLKVPETSLPVTSTPSNAKSNSNSSYPESPGSAWLKQIYESFVDVNYSESHENASPEDPEEPNCVFNEEIKLVWCKGSETISSPEVGDALDSGIPQQEEENVCKEITVASFAELLAEPDLQCLDNSEPQLEDGARVSSEENVLFDISEAGMELTHLEQTIHSNFGHNDIQDWSEGHEEGPASSTVSADLEVFLQEDDHFFPEPILVAPRAQRNSSVFGEVGSVSFPDDQITGLDLNVIDNESPWNETQSNVSEDTASQVPAKVLCEDTPSGYSVLEGYSIVGEAVSVLPEVNETSDVLNSDNIGVSDWSDILDEAKQPVDLPENASLPKEFKSALPEEMPLLDLGTDNNNNNLLVDGEVNRTNLEYDHQSNNQASLSPLDHLEFKLPGEPFDFSEDLGALLVGSNTQTSYCHCDEEMYVTTVPLSPIFFEEGMQPITVTEDVVHSSKPYGSDLLDTSALLRSLRDKKVVSTLNEEVVEAVEEAVKAVVEEPVEVVFDESAESYIMVTADDSAKDELHSFIPEQMAMLNLADDEQISSDEMNDSSDPNDSLQLGIDGTPAHFSKRDTLGLIEFSDVDCIFGQGSTAPQKFIEDLGKNPSVESVLMTEITGTVPADDQAEEMAHDNNGDDTFGDKATSQEDTASIKHLGANPSAESVLKTENTRIVPMDNEAEEMTGASDELTSGDKPVFVEEHSMAFDQVSRLDESTSTPDGTSPSCDKNVWQRYLTDDSGCSSDAIFHSESELSFDWENLQSPCSTGVLTDHEQSGMKTGQSPVELDMSKDKKSCMPFHINKFTHTFMTQKKSVEAGVSQTRLVILKKSDPNPEHALRNLLDHEISSSPELPACQQLLSAMSMMDNRPSACSNDLVKDFLRDDVPSMENPPSSKNVFPGLYTWGTSEGSILENDSLDTFATGERLVLEDDDSVNMACQRSC